MKNFKSIISGILFISLLLLAACGDEDKSEGSSGEKQEVEEEQHLIYASDSDIIGLSPIDTSHVSSQKVFSLIHETLFVQNPETAEIEPHLVESYDTLDDLTWVFELKEDIKFHDGTDFNAEAVKYTFEELVDPDRAAPLGSVLEPIESIEVEDEYTLKITTKRPLGSFLSILSQDTTAIVSPTADKEGNSDTENPVGTGPFVFDEWVQGDHITLNKNPDYWQGEITLDTFEMRVVPEFSTAVSMLETGEIDLVDEIQPEHLSRIESMDDVEMQIEDSTSVFYLGFNFEKEPFNNKKFREAVTHAVNVPEIVEQLNGLGTENKSFVGPNLFGYKEEAQDVGHDYDLEKAKELVEENGFGDEEYTILVQDSLNFMTISEIIQAQLMDAGFNISLEVMDPSAYFDASVGGDYEMSVFGWTTAGGDGSDLLYIHHSDNFEMENRLKYVNEEYDELVDEARYTVDQDERVELIHNANVYALEDFSLLPIYHGVVSIAYRDDVEGIELTSTGTFLLDNASKK